jgi:hypothetical protein
VGGKRKKRRKKLPSQQHGLLVKSSSIYNMDVYLNENFWLHLVALASAYTVPPVCSDTVV